MQGVGRLPIEGSVIVSRQSGERWTITQTDDRFASTPLGEFKGISGYNKNGFPIRSDTARPPDSSPDDSGAPGADRSAVGRDAHHPPPIVRAICDVATIRHVHATIEEGQSAPLIL